MISVVVPCFNEKAARISMTLASIRDVVPAADVIVVDDYSAVPVVLDSVRVVRLSQNRGAAGALNVGYEAAADGLIGRIDCGDVWLPEMATMIATALANCTPAMFGRSIDGNDQRVRNPRANWNKAIFQDGQFALSGAITTRAVWLRERFDESFRFVDDWDWSCRVQSAIGWTFHDAAPVAIATQYADSSSPRDPVALKAARTKIIKRNRELRTRGQL